jgi:hypothetical protein
VSCEKGPIGEDAVKKRFFFAVLTLVWALGGAAWAQSEEKVVVLRTGEVVRGVTVKEGTAYKVQSELLGPLTIQEVDVVSVHEAGDAADEWQKRKDQLMSDPAAMASIQGMVQDKEILDFVMDPEVQRALKEQDIEALRSNPKFIQFANNPQVQKLVEESMAKEKQ